APCGATRSQALSRASAAPRGCRGCARSRHARCTSDGRERSGRCHPAECPAWSEPPSLPLQLRSRSPPPCYRPLTPGCFSVNYLRCRLVTVKAEKTPDFGLGNQDAPADLYGVDVAPVDLVADRFVRCA